MAAAVNASISVFQYASDGTTVLASTTGITPGSSFHITIASTDVRSILIKSTSPTTESMGTITIDDDAWGNDISLYIAQNKSVADGDFWPESSDIACQNCAGVVDSRDSGNLHLKAYFGGNLTGKVIGPVISSIQKGFSRINTLQVTGTVQSRVWGRAGLFLIRCGSAERLSGQSAPDKTAFVSDESIGLIQAMSGDIDCDILANLSSNSGGFEIAEIAVEAGALGSISSDYPKIGTAGTANVSIGRITARNAIRAHIIAKQGIGYIKTTGVVVGGVITEGGMKGTLEINKIINQPTEGGLLDLAGNFESTTTITSEFPADARMIVGTYFGD